MIVRFGFVAMSVIMEDASPSGTVTLKTYLKYANQHPEAALEKVRQVARKNLLNSLRLLRYCVAHDVRLYRFSSKLIPLATHPELNHWDYISDLKPQLTELGHFIKENRLRVSFHPDHYTLLNSPHEGIYNASVADLAYHCNIFDAMGLDERAKLIIHIGGGYNKKEEALERFARNWCRLPENIRKRIALENDDKTYTAENTLALCKKLQIPMVLDLHHYRCNHEEGSKLKEIYPGFISTWKGTGLAPKIHVSSPRSEAAKRSHHDYVEAKDLYSFLLASKVYRIDLDVMVEAKQKDKAMFGLVEELGKNRHIKILNKASINIECPPKALSW